MDLKGPILSLLKKYITKEDIAYKEIYYKRGHSLAFFLVLTRDEVEVSCLPACWCPQCSAVNCLVLWMLEE